MPYVFPKHRLKANTPMDYEEINENFQELIGEASGALNEHNFNSKAFPLGIAAAPIGPMFCWFNSAVLVDPAFNCGWVAENSVGIGSRDFTEEQPDLFYQRVQGTWEKISRLAKTFSATGGSYWVLASFQHDGRSKYQEDSIPEKFWDHYGALYAIRVNGQIIYETVTGGVHNNPVIAQGSVRDGTGSSPTHPRVKVSNTGHKVYDTHAIHGDTGLFPVSLDFILDLPPGTNTVDVVMQTLAHPQPGNVSVSNRELIILEMRA